jgi:pimeloyl-ACP methyl ester carboxylesterase
MIRKKGSPEPFLEYVSTSDGWKLATYRYRASSRNYPAILIHGLGTNRFDVDFPDLSLSLAKYLSRKGYDTWVIELRGTGMSCRNGWIQDTLAKSKGDWTFDDYIFKDLPALVGHIQKRTKRKKLHWIGHSLGGTIVYAAIETLGNEVCASAVTLGAAMSSTAKPGIIKTLLKLDPLYKKIPFLPLKRLARLASPSTRWLAPVEDNFIYGSKNIDLETIETGLRKAVENVSTTVFLQMHDWYKNNHFRAHDRNFSYRDNLKKIRAPFLVCAGSVDGLTPYPDVHFGYREISSKDKKFRVFGRDHGCRTEYAHVDLVLGKNAPREVFPEIANWLNRHDKR